MKATLPRSLPPIGCRHAGTVLCVFAAKAPTAFALTAAHPPHPPGKPFRSADVGLEGLYATNPRRRFTMTDET